MTKFAEPPDDTYAPVFLEDTDRLLPDKINASTRYAYFKTIARGGKCIIQSCKDMHLGRTICYKKLKPEFADNPTEQRRFVREARVSAMLQHPNTVPTYELGRDSHGQLYFTMKLVHGFTLRELLAPDYRERYDLIQLVDVVIEVAHALAYAHSHRVVHRDIKPDNILVGPFDEVVLMDWGLAKVWNEDGSANDLPPGEDVDPDAPATSLTGQGNLEGTAAYMSPEQIRRDPGIDYRTDIYSLGVILYEILARRTPFEAETVRGMIDQILNDAPPKPSEVTKMRVPEALEKIAMRCIAKRPDQRVHDCTELVRLLRDEWNPSAG
jgi:serine/threonine-protein kinase